MVKEQVESKGVQNLWIESDSDKSSGVKFDGSCVSLISDPVLGTQGSGELSMPQHKEVLNDKSISGGNLGLTERAFSAAGAAFLSAIIVNPLDLAKVIHIRKYFLLPAIIICFGVPQFILLFFHVIKNVFLQTVYFRFLIFNGTVYYAISVFSHPNCKIIMSLIYDFTSC